MAGARRRAAAGPAAGRPPRGEGRHRWRPVPRLYRDFLDECTRLIDDGDLRAGHQLYAEAAALWTDVSGLIAKAGESGDAGYLEQAGVILHDLSRIEKDAMQLLRQL
ncbi:hypothetical protein FHU36_000315 [Nonomuraea muscovyensis]|uniref:DUF4872 domain-containing protein n=1 Tax=Nonomuraea muscovyensis TaxID=1124761 RepID=A0A7X0EWN3_9ACTN|nr:hypothetical protein [Nonomuraea muscovyensis]